MNTFLRAILTATILLSVSTATWAQGMNVALLDVGYIFKKHAGFNQKMAEMKASVAAFEKNLQGQQSAIQTQSRQLSELKPGTKQYKDLEEQTTKQLAALKVNMQLERKNIMEKEAKIYMETYQQVMTSVAAFANAKKIDLVLRYDREATPNAEANPQETLKIINRPVIFEKGLDISDTILRQVGGVATRPVPQATRK